MPRADSELPRQTFLYAVRLRPPLLVRFALDLSPVATNAERATVALSKHRQVALGSSGVDAIEEPPCKGLLTLPETFLLKLKMVPSPQWSLGLGERRRCRTTYGKW